jgi:inner membrane transporter RhtA
MSLEPAMAALAGFVLLGESLRARQLLALVLVSVASAGAAWGDRPAEEAEPVVADAVAEGAAVP